MVINPPHGVRYDLRPQENIVTLSENNEQSINSKILNTNKLISDSKDKLILKREELDKIIKSDSISKKNKILLFEQKQKINKTLKELNKCQKQLNKARTTSNYNDTVKIKNNSISNLNISGADIIIGASVILLCTGILIGTIEISAEMSKYLCAAGGLVLFIGTPTIAKNINRF